ncbi:hypothetical protein Tco_0233436 [Tanacetum coccineum]
MLGDLGLGLVIFDRWVGGGALGKDLGFVVSYINKVMRKGRWRFYLGSWSSCGGNWSCFVAGGRGGYGVGVVLLWLGVSGVVRGLGLGGGCSRSSSSGWGVWEGLGMGWAVGLRGRRVYLTIGRGGAFRKVGG